MRKKFLNRLSVKVFLITFLMQILAGGAILVVLYFATPSTYLSKTDEDYIQVFDLVNRLQHVDEVTGSRMIDEFISDTGIDIAIYDAEKSTPDKKVLAETHSKRALKTEEEVRAREEKVSGEDESGTFTYWYVNEGTIWQSEGNTRYEIAYFFNTEKQNVLPRSVRTSLPLMVLVITGISLLCSVIYTFLFARPVKKLSDISHNMAEMDFSQKCNTKRGDEIGDLGRDLDAMAESLQEKMGALKKRTSELEEEVAHRKELESQKDMFFSAASHELKTPVTILEGQIRGMIDGVKPYTDHEVYLPRALGTVKRMESLINEILTASRMQSGKEIVASRVDMVQLLEEKMEECEDLFMSRGLRMELSFENDLIFDGNKELTSLAVGAFISNAAFYSEEGTTVFVEAENVKDDVDRTVSENEKVIRVLIRNAGHIEEEDLAHLFEPFYRADKSRNRKSGGSGLGLYLARLIIEKQGGSCLMKNDGKDVLATIEIPAASGEKLEEDHAASGEKEEEDRAAAGGEMKPEDGASEKKK